MQIVRVVLFILFLTIYPPVISCAFLPPRKNGAYTIVLRWCFGWCLIYAVLYWPAVICILTRRSLNLLIAVWGILLLVLTVYALWKIRRRGIGLFGEMREYLSGLTFPEIAASAAVLAHAAVTAFMMHIDGDDYTYVANATTSLDTNTLLRYNGGIGKYLSKYATEGLNRLVAAPHFTYYAAVSKVFGTRPAPLCHTYLPPFFTCLCFASLFLLGYELFRGDRRKTGLFAVFAFLVSIFSYYSVYTAQTFMLIRVWQGKAQVAGFVIPMILWLFLVLIRKGSMERTDVLMLAVFLEASCLLTAMGALLCAGEALVLSVIAALILKQKKLFLYTLPALLLPLATALIYLKYN